MKAQLIQGDSVDFLTIYKALKATGDKHELIIEWDAEKTMPIALIHYVNNYTDEDDDDRFMESEDKTTKMWIVGINMLKED